MNRTIRWLIAVSLLWLAASCRPGGPGADADPADWLQEDEFHLVLPSGLRLDGYQLESPPALDPLSFTAVDGKTRVELDNLSFDAQAGPAAVEFYFDGQNRCLDTSWQGKVLTACERYADAPGSDQEGVPQAVVEVSADGAVVFTGQAGAVSPVEPLRGLWVVEDSWVLEYAEVRLGEDGGENPSPAVPLGHLIRDGQSWNEKDEFEEEFGFQLLSGKPFFFYQRDGELGISYDGKETVLGLDGIPHYRCCSAAVLNPRREGEAVSFFGRKTGTWYYMEIHAAE